MKNATVFIGSIALLLSSCETHTGTGALAGGALGAGTGAIIGGGKGAAIGGAVGALGGGLVGAALDAQDRKIMEQQSPQTLNRIDSAQQLSIADVRSMHDAGLNENVIISQIQATGSIYYLSSQEIIDLKNAGVPQKVINYMIQTGQSGGY